MLSLTLPDSHSDHQTGSPLNYSHLRASLRLQVDFLHSYASERSRIRHRSITPDWKLITQPAFCITSSQTARSPSFYRLHFPISCLALLSPYSIPRKSHSFPWIQSADSLRLQLHLSALSRALDSYFQLLLQLFQMHFTSISILILLKQDPWSLPPPGPSTSPCSLSDHDITITPKILSLKCD